MSFTILEGKAPYECLPLVPGEVFGHGFFALLAISSSGVRANVTSLVITGWNIVNKGPYLYLE